MEINLRVCMDCGRQIVKQGDKDVAVGEPVPKTAYPPGTSHGLCHPCYQKRMAEVLAYRRNAGFKEFFSR